MNSTTPTDLLSKIAKLETENRRLQDELAKAESGSQTGQEQYQLLFQNLPLGAQEENYSSAKIQIERLIRNGVVDLETYFLEHQDELIRIVDNLEVISVNKTLIDIHNAPSIEEFLEEEDNIEEWWTYEWVEYYAAEFSRLAEGNSYFGAERNDTKFDGSPFLSRIFTFIVAGCEDSWERIITLHEDITIQKKMELQLLETHQALEKQIQLRTRELKDSELKLSAFFRNSNTTISIKDVDSRYTIVSRQFEVIYGLNADEAIGKMPEDIFDPELACLIRAHDQEVITEGKLIQREVAIPNTDPRVVLLATKFPINTDEGEITGVGTISIDISGRKQIEVALNDAKVKADKANRVKSEFLATMSHEIRTPLSSVIGMTQLLADTSLNDDQKDFLSAITNSGNSLLSLINGILDFSKLDAEMVEVETVAFDLERVCQECLELVAGNVVSKTLDFIFDYHPECPRHLVGDPSRVRQILVNLLGNAVKFTTEGFIRLSVDLDNSDSNIVHLEVEDTGIGLKAESIENLFESFTQADSTTTRKYGGTGLGLAITKKLVELMKGSIVVESEFGKGTTFNIDLPFARAETPQQLTCNSFDDLRILLAESNLQNVRVFRRLLQHMGARVTVLKKSEHILEELRNSVDAGDGYHIAIIADDFAEKGGLDTGRVIRQDDQFKPLKLLMFSTAGQRGDASLFTESGFNAYINKLCRYETLRSILSSMLDHQIGQPIITQHSVEDARRSNDESPSAFDATILLVEDIKVNQIVAGKFLDKLGVNFDIANNGNEAIEAYAAGNYDLVFMDCHMPIKDGYDATRVIRSLEADQDKPETPIIALTANASSEDFQLCLRSGMNGMVTKPFRLNDLSMALNKWLPDQLGH
ncbi:MAG: PAS domain S-box-containing protein [Enterobacterales bacterium]